MASKTSQIRHITRSSYRTEDGVHYALADKESVGCDVDENEIVFQETLSRTIMPAT